MNCKEAIELLSALIDETLDVETKKAVELHLSQCSNCAKELETLKTILQATHNIEFVEPPRELSHRIASAIAAAQCEQEQCEKASSAISAFLDGELSSYEIAGLNEHVANCGRCANEIRLLRGLIDKVKMIGFVEPPPDLRARITASVVAEKRGRRSRHGLLTRLADWLPPAPVKIGYAFAACAAVAGVVFYLSQEPNANKCPTVAKESKVTTAQIMPNDSPRIQENTQTNSPMPAYSKEQTSSTQPGAVRRVAKRYSGLYAALPASRARKSDIPATATSKMTLQHNQLESTAQPDESNPTVSTSVETTAEESTVNNPSKDEAVATLAKPETSSSEAKVASLPLIQPEKIEEMMREVKMQAQMRRASEQSVSIAIVRSKF